MIDSYSSSSNSGKNITFRYNDYKEFLLYTYYPTSDNGRNIHTLYGRTNLIAPIDNFRNNWPSGNGIVGGSIAITSTYPTTYMSVYSSGFSTTLTTVLYAR